MPNTSLPPVLIVGSGPSGLVSALTLVKNGISVRIIEKLQADSRRGQRGAGIQPRSLELFSHLGVVDAVLAKGIEAPLMRQYGSTNDREPLREFSLTPHRDPTPTNPFLNLYILGQDNLEAILSKALNDLGVYVEYGTELVSLKQNDAHVEVLLRKGNVDEASQYPWVIGADGAKGEVRKQLGLAFIGDTKIDAPIVIGDILVDGLDAKYWHVFGNPSDLAISLRTTETERLFSFAIAGKNVDADHLSSSEVTIYEFLKEKFRGRPEISFGKIVWTTLYRPNVRMVDAFGSGRVFVAGDAAHVHPPTGAQGLNSGVQDSFNLAWKLALVIKGHASPKLLESYTEERLPVIAEVLNISSNLLKNYISSSASAFRSLGDTGLQLGINYRWSSIVLDENRLSLDGASKAEIDAYGKQSDGSLQAGDRAPNSTGLAVLGSQGSDTTQLFQIFAPTHHTVLIFADAVDWAEALQKISQYPKDLVKSIVLTRSAKFPLAEASQADLVLEDREGVAHKAYVEGTSSGLVIVRPDGVVGAILKSSDLVQQYFQGISYTD